MLTRRKQAYLKNPNWKHDFWGSNYERLSSIKTKWDPKHLFYVTPGINADYMAATADGRVCPVKPSVIKADATGFAPTGDSLNIGKHDKGRTTWPLLYTAKGQAPVQRAAPVSKGTLGGIPRVDILQAV